jgi:GTP-binding protein
LARVSRTPGRTRQINFFVLGDALMLADLPGYGFANAGKREIAEWNRMTAAYLRGRAQLRRLCLLIDARLGPGEADRVVMGQLDRAAVSYQLVLTKCDKVTRDALESQCARVAGDIKTHAAAYPELIATSAVKRYGIAELRAALAELAR